MSFSVELSLKKFYNLGPFKPNNKHHPSKDVREVSVTKDVREVSVTKDVREVSVTKDVREVSVTKENKN